MHFGKSKYKAVYVIAKAGVSKGMREFLYSVLAYHRARS